jgi:hypothetical protein
MAIAMQVAVEIVGNKKQDVSLSRLSLSHPDSDCGEQQKQKEN